MHRRIVLLGPPAAGKGTQAELLKREFGFDTPSVGAMLRQQKAAGTPAGLRAAEYFDRGLLVPDEITIEVVRHWLSGNGGLLDSRRVPAHHRAMRGFRSDAPGRWASAVDAAIFLNIDEPVVRERASRRLVCPACGGIFRRGLHVARCKGPAPLRGHRSTRRDAMTNRNAVTRRLAEYRERTAPV